MIHKSYWGSKCTHFKGIKWSADILLTPRGSTQKVGTFKVSLWMKRTHCDWNGLIEAWKRSLRLSLCFKIFLASFWLIEGHTQNVSWKLIRLTVTEKDSLGFKRSYSGVIGLTVNEKRSLCFKMSNWGWNCLIGSQNCSLGLKRAHLTSFSPCGWKGLIET